MRSNILSCEKLFHFINTTLFACLAFLHQTATSVMQDRNHNCKIYTKIFEYFIYWLRRNWHSRLTWQSHGAKIPISVAPSSSSRFLFIAPTFLVFTAISSTRSSWLLSLRVSARISFLLSLQCLARGGINTFRYSVKSQIEHENKDKSCI